MGEKKDFTGLFDLCYLHAWPLITDKPPVEPIDRLDFEKEREVLQSELQSVGRKLRVHMGVATVENLRRRIIEGCIALHYTGHGLKDEKESCLAFEDGAGKMHRVTGQMLKDVMRAQAEDKKLKLVLVSACYSEDSGNAFANAGVPHVIAVNSLAQVQDKSSRRFMSSFYFHLFRGGTVRHAFMTARQAVQQDPSITRADEYKRFVLIREDDNHDDVLFRHVEPGPWVNLSPPPVPLHAPSLTSHFRGRELEMERLIRLMKRRSIAITGPKGIGKTTFAVAAARYVARFVDEGSFGLRYDGVFFLPIEKTIGPENVATQFLRAMKHKPLRAAETIQRLITLINTTKVLLVLDGLNTRNLLGIRKLVSELFGHCANLHVITTSSSETLGALGPPASRVPDYLFELKPLDQKDCVQLFYALRPREYTAMEFRMDPTRLIELQKVLMNSEVMKICAGNPQSIAEAAALMATCSWPELPEKLRELLEHKSSTPDGDSEFETPGGGAPPPTPTPTPILPIAPPPTPPPTPPPIPAPSIAPDLKLQSFITDDANRELWQSRFGERGRVEWGEFESLIMDYFVQSTELEYRLLDHQDVKVIQKKLEANSPPGYVSAYAFGVVWTWYKPLVRMVRMMSEEWCWDKPRLVWGFISRDQCYQKLVGHPVGSFLIRFSDSSPGSLAVTFISEKMKPESTLIDFRPDDRFQLKNDPLTYDSLSKLVLSVRQFRTLYPGVEKGTAFKLDGPL